MNIPDDGYLLELLSGEMLPFEPIYTSLTHNLKWENIEQNEKIFPEHTDRALWMIRVFAGYDPRPCDYLPHEVFIRTVIDQYLKGLLSHREFNSTMVDHCINIRNDEMHRLTFVTKPKYDEEDYYFYLTDMPEFTQKARDRMCLLLGEEFPEEYTLYAELYLRMLCADEDYYTDLPLGDVLDKQAVRIALFRREFLERGIESAHKLPLLPYHPWK